MGRDVGAVPPDCGERVYVVSDSRGPVAAYWGGSPAMAYADSLKRAGVANVRLSSVRIHGGDGRAAEHGQR